MNTFTAPSNNKNSKLFGGVFVSNRVNSKDPNKTSTNNNGLVERNITSEDMKELKNALDNKRNYISGTAGWSSSSHQFTEGNSNKE